MGFPFVADGWKKVSREYDFDRNYGAFHDTAQQDFTRRSQIMDCDLVRLGAEKVRVYSEQEAAKIRERIDAGLKDWSDRRQIADILFKVFNPEMDRRIISYFGSEYTPTKVGFNVHEGDGSLKVSGGWHCDGGPSKHLVIIVYLTPSMGVTGNTIFSDRATTEKLKDAGYICCRISDRAPDIKPVLDELGLPAFDEWHFDLDAGEALVFDAPNLMHKGVPPAAGRRYTMAIAVVPNDKHWMEEFRAGVFPFADGKGAGTFPPRFF